MKPATLAARQTIERNHAVRVKPRLIAEWEFNRFTIPTVTVSPAQTGDEEWLVEYGDTATIALPNRPRTGIAKARTENGIKPASDYRDAPNASRFYPSSPDDLYEYWSSVQRTKLVPNNGAYAFDSPIVITVMYPEAVPTNKIVAGFETSYAKPVEFSIHITTNGTTWTKVTPSISPIVGSDGRVTLWNGTNGWDTDPNYEWPVIIKGVRLTVNSMSKPFVHLDVLQLGARLENNLTDFLIDYTVQMEVSDRSFIAPLGKASSNQASITLSNLDSRFNNYNEESLYYGMIDKKVKFTLDLGIDASGRGGIAYEYVREFTGWTESWGGQDQTSVKVDLKDSSCILQEMKMPVVFFENTTTGAIIWQVMDRVGMTNYSYERATQDYGQVIPFYWPEGDNTVWEEFANLAEATQTAIYFDENDVLQIRARKAMYGDKAVDWNFDAIANGQKLPDIETANIDYELETNTVEVNYKPANYSDFNKGVPKLETSWEPEEEMVVLRASGLTRDLMKTGTELWIRQPEAIYWPYESIVNIRGEVLRYKGKEYGYYRADGALEKKVIFSEDERKTINGLNENLSWKNAFTGKLIVTERQMFGSALGDHVVQPDLWTNIITNCENTVFYPWQSGGTQYMDGFVRQTNNSNPGHLQYHLRKHPSVVKPLPGGDTVWYGMRFRFPGEADATPTANWKIGGMWIAGDWGDAGYFLEITPTAQIDGWEERRWRNELCLIAMPGDAPAWAVERVSPSGLDEDTPKIFGYAAPISSQVWYDLDMSYTLRASDGKGIVAAYINGVFYGTWEIPAARRPNNEWRFGTHIRGFSTMDVEYVYAVSRDETDARTPDETNWLDLRRGGYTSGYVEKEIKYNFHNINPYYYPHYFPQRLNDSTFAFDEFGPVVHEVRQFDVKFKEESRPVAHSMLYLSNEGQVETLYYEPNAFGASFMLANATRHDAVLKGEDQITLGVDDTINRQMFIYGRSVYQEEEKKVTKTDDLSVRKRGVTRTEVASRYIQTDEMANELGQWIIDLWATGVDQVTLSTFGNPFIQLGDLVTINYPVKGMYPATHKYFVTSIQNDFNEGYKTEFILRRARV